MGLEAMHKWQRDNPDKMREYAKRGNAALREKYSAEQLSEWSRKGQSRATESRRET